MTKQKIAPIVKQLRIWLVSIIVLCVGAVAAQRTSCSAIVQQALDQADAECQSVKRNQACYGNVDMQAEPQPDAADQFDFASVGDITDVGNIQSLALSPLHEEDSVWGVAVMKLQANLPDTLPGQNVTFLAYGDTRIENAAAENQNPMQAVYLRTGISQTNCVDAPEDGLLVQTPDGDAEVMFNINGVDVSMGSTVFFEAQPGGTMKISTVEGSAIVNIGGELFPAIAGSWTEIRMDDNLRPIGFPSLPDTYAPDKFDSLPTRLLERKIEIAPPLDETTLNTLRDRLQLGDAPCGDGLIDCDALPNFNERDWDIRSNHWDVDFAAGNTCAVTLGTATLTKPVCPPTHLQAQCSADADRPFFCTLQAVQNRIANPLTDYITPDQIFEQISNQRRGERSPDAALDDTTDTLDDTTDTLDDTTDTLDDTTDTLDDTTDTLDDTTDTLDDTTKEMTDEINDTGILDTDALDSPLQQD